MGPRRTPATASRAVQAFPFPLRFSLSPIHHLLLLEREPRAAARDTAAPSLSPLPACASTSMVNAPPSNGSVVVPVLCPCEGVVLRPCRLGLPMRDGIERNRRGLAAAHFAGEHEALSGDFFAL